MAQEKKRFRKKGIEITSAHMRKCGVCGKYFEVKAQAEYCSIKCWKNKWRVK